jgi:hypothetical protein
MSIKPDSLIFFESPEVEYAGNFFKNVPIILEYDDIPLIEVVQEQTAGFTTQFQIFNKNGIYIAKVKGSQLYLTKDGSKSNIKLRHPDRMTVCELDGQTMFEVRRKDASALKTQAELFTPDGRFMKSNNHGAPSGLISSDGSYLKVGTNIMVGCRIQSCRVGIHISSKGT